MPDNESGTKSSNSLRFFFFLFFSALDLSLHFFQTFLSPSCVVILRLVGRKEKARAEKGKGRSRSLVIDSRAFPVESRETNNSVRGGGCAHPQRMSDK